mgnify:CR=1 FL=1
MTLSDLLAARRMVRSFDGRAVPGDLLSELATTALLSPTAGNSAGVRMTVVDQSRLAEYFSVATDDAWRRGAPRAAGLMRAGGVVLITSRPQDYLARYSEPDKAESGLGDPQQWAIPYWHTDAAMATMSLLLLLEEHELVATIWGNFRHEENVLTWAGAGDERLFATVLVGYPDGNDTPSASLARPVPPRAKRVRRLSGD